MTDAPGRLGAILLAAGASTRFAPGNKLLAPFGGVPLIRRTATTLLDAGLETMVVTGHESEAVVASLSGLPVKVAHNPSWAEGMGGSVAVGASALPRALAGAFVVPGDMPLLDGALLARLEAAFRAAACAAPVHPVTAAGSQRNPVLWPASMFSALAALSGAAGGKALLSSAAPAAVAVPVADDAALADADTVEDLTRAESRV